MEIAVILVIILSLIFDFLNGVRDSSNIVATMISSRSLPPRAAMILVACSEFIGPFLFGVALATTIGHEIVEAASINTYILLAALLSAIIWNLLTWYLGLPSSSSHALVGGFVGSVMIGAGWSAIKLEGLGKVLIALFSSPIIGFVVGYFVLRALLLLSWKATPFVNTIFRRSQIITSIGLGLSHGSNDAQKSMGIITLALMTGGVIDSFTVPVWVIFSCSLMIALGTSMGGWKLIRTLGSKIYRIRPIDGLSSQISSAVVILGASLVGGPVSTTQVVSSAIMGVGAAERVNKVRWKVAGEIATAWLLTIPATALVAAGIYWIILRIVS